MFQGEFNTRGKAVGFHHRGSIGHAGHARVVQVIDGPNAEGLYRARVEILDPTTGQWASKGQPSTFFPDVWSRARVLDEIRGAFRQRHLTRGHYWEG
ncbi:MAG: EndoU domain-containing protein, partial [Candidatus Tectomicrobia bacterium]|nr:EndoU domain-containing protein [Candidatus Tectomicrobia bacterium]